MALTNEQSNKLVTLGNLLTFLTSLTNKFNGQYLTLTTANGLYAPFGGVGSPNQFSVGSVLFSGSTNVIIKPEYNNIEGYANKFRIGRDEASTSIPLPKTGHLTLVTDSDLSQVVSSMTNKADAVIVQSDKKFTVTPCINVLAGVYQKVGTSQQNFQAEKNNMQSGDIIYVGGFDDIDNPGLYIVNETVPANRFIYKQDIAFVCSASPYTLYYGQYGLKNNSFYRYTTTAGMIAIATSQNTVELEGVVYGIAEDGDIVDLLLGLGFEVGITDDNEE